MPLISLNNNEYNVFQFYFDNYVKLSNSHYVVSSDTYVFYCFYCY